MRGGGRKGGSAEMRRGRRATGGGERKNEREGRNEDG